MATSPVADQDRWFRCFHPSPENGMRLFCFPHAGGSASYYFAFSSALPPEIEVLSVQYPGRQDRRFENCVDNISELADGIYEAIKPWSGRPFAFFGHSMGAILAFEVARRFQPAGGGPQWLFASGRRAPGRQRPHETVHLRDEDGMAEELRKLGGTDPRILDDDELRRMILPMTRSDYKAIETYACTPGPRLDCPITAIIGDRDPQVTVEEAIAWGEHSARGFHLCVMPGGHFYLDARRAEVVAEVSVALTKAHQPARSKGERDEEV